MGKIEMEIKFERGQMKIQPACVCYPACISEILPHTFELFTLTHLIMPFGALVLDEYFRHASHRLN